MSLPTSGRPLKVDTPLGRTVAAVVAVTAWAAIGLRTYITIGEFIAAGDTAFDGLAHLSKYFTIWTNILVACAMTAVALGRWPGGERSSDAALAATALYMALVGVVNHMLLRGLTDFTGPERIADILLHYVAPGLMIAFWALFAPKARLAYRHVFLWLTFPLAYCASALARGAASGKYPYPFLNVEKLGIERVLINAALMGLAIFVVGAAAVAIAKRGGRGQANRAIRRH